jgi:hypothetical protein
MDVLLIPILFLVSSANNEEAKQATLQAYGKQSGIERMLDDWQQRELNPGLRTGVGNTLFFVKVIAERHIAVEWRF